MTLEWLVTAVCGLDHCRSDLYVGLEQKARIGLNQSAIPQKFCLMETKSDHTRAKNTCHKLPRRTLLIQHPSTPQPTDKTSCCVLWIHAGKSGNSSTSTASNSSLVVRKGWGLLGHWTYRKILIRPSTRYV